MGVKTSDIGDIPSLSNLQYLILVGCSFRGPIPDSIGSLKQLVYLGLNNYSFIGFIPPSIGNLTNLSWLDLSDNQLSGPIPISNDTAFGLDMLVKAKHFHLENNQLSGPIQHQLFNSNVTLIHVRINNNRLSGTIPSSIGTMETLEVVRLDSNSLNVTVPPNITNLKSVSELHLSNNKLSGPVPNLIGMNSLFYVDMSNNSFDTSAIPTWFTLPSVTTLLMDKTQLQPQLERLGLSNNGLNGTLDVGNSYSSELTVDLTNNSIANFTQNSGYNFS